MAALELLTQILESPGTLTPDVTRKMKENLAADAHGTARTSQNELMERLALTGGLRGGSAVRGSAEIASNLGEKIATGSRDIDILAATQNRQDTVQAINQALQYLAERFKFPLQKANAQIGGASLLTQLAGQPTPLQSGFQGVGQLLGNIVSAPSGFSNIFGGR